MTTEIKTTANNKQHWWELVKSDWNNSQRFTNRENKIPFSEHVKGLTGHVVYGYIVEVDKENTGGYKLERVPEKERCGYCKQLTTFSPSYYDGWMRCDNCGGC